MTHISRKAGGNFLAGLLGSVCVIIFISAGLVLAQDDFDDLFMDEEPSADVAEPVVVDLEDAEVEPELDDTADVGFIDPAADELPAEVLEEDTSVGGAIDGAITDAVDSKVLDVELDPEARKIAEVQDEEVLRRIAKYHHAMETLSKADSALESGSYDKAVKYYDEALKYMMSLPISESIKRKADNDRSTSLYRHAVMLRTQREYEEAIKAAQKAAAAGHPGAPKLISMIQDEQEAARLEKEKEIPIPHRIKQDDFEEWEKDVSKHLRMAREYMVGREFDMAEEYIGRVLKRDPYNTEAIRLLQKVAKIKYDHARHEVNATRMNAAAAVKETWNPRNYGVNEDDVKDVRLDPVGGETADSISKIMRKMESIKIPEIDFREANIHDVIDFLRDASEDYDPSTDPLEPKGINIILHLDTSAPSAGGAPSPAPADDIFGFSDASASSGGGGPVTVPAITFSARYITLQEALRLVTQVGGLKYRIEGSVVMIVPAGAPDGEIITRMYPVLPSAMQRIKDIRATTESAGAGIFGGGEGQLTTDQEYREQDWVNFFSELGVQWPDGSTIRYLPNIGKLSVANTPNNLAVFEKVLNDLNVTPFQIEIEARFVEINQDDLESLGFEWILRDDWEIARKKASAGDTIGALERIQVDGDSRGFTKGFRFLSNEDELLEDYTDIPEGQFDDMLSISGILTNPELSFVLHMLERKGHSDILSAPKITTQAGQEAVIKVVTEYLYPTEFTVTPLQATDNLGVSRIIGGIVEPSGFEMREVGVILVVIPDVAEDGSMINLSMTPEVVSEPTWMQYGSEYTVQEVTQILPMPQPFFHTRSLQTTISVYNGATVAMGGMITELRNSVDERIPFLGDIPLIGRLFRNQYEESIKRNLMIFVTAKLVDPAGRVVKQQTGETYVTKVGTQE